MSGCYVLCLPNPDPSFLYLFDFLGIFLCACWIVWHLWFYSKSPKIYQQNSSFHFHQPYQSIINQQWLHDYFLDSFCSLWDFFSLPCLLQDFDSHESWMSIFTLICHWMIVSLPKINHSLSYIGMHSSHCGLWMTPFVSTILVLQLTLLH